MADPPSSEPDSIVQIAANWHELLGITGLRFDTVLEQISHLPFEATMSFLSAVAAGLYHARREPHLHLLLATEVFGEGPALEAIRRFSETGPNRLIFDERDLAVLQRLLVEHAAPEPARDLTSRERATALVSLISVDAKARPLRYRSVSAGGIIRGHL